MANKKIPLRKCVACNEMKEKKEMIRVIKTPENEIMLDATGRKNGVEHTSVQILGVVAWQEKTRDLSAP